MKLSTCRASPWARQAPVPHVCVPALHSHACAQVRSGAALGQQACTCPCMAQMICGMYWQTSGDQGSTVVQKGWPITSNCVHASPSFGCMHSPTTMQVTCRCRDAGPSTMWGPEAFPYWAQCMDTWQCIPTVCFCVCGMRLSARTHAHIPTCYDANSCTGTCMATAASILSTALASASLCCQEHHTGFFQPDTACPCCPSAPFTPNSCVKPAKNTHDLCAQSVLWGYASSSSTCMCGLLYHTMVVPVLCKHACLGMGDQWLVRWVIIHACKGATLQLPPATATWYGHNCPHSPSRNELGVGPCARWG